ncbi:hypothetical protein HW555_001707 [Spodoptera exigua]|uniref:Uncharacterized protein n=1 Tax=Spodoptera exigua TaxID=7107 RepID=A0A835GNS2_SPOEX|nr:hypothetical protein HW555_001707 [Spodoptera exigua]
MNEPPDDPGGGLTPLEVPEASNFITYPPNCPPREESDGSFFDTDASENTNTSTLKRKRVSVRKICKQCNKKKRKHRKVDGPVPSNECQCIFDDEMAVPTQSLGNNFTSPAPLHSSTPLLNESNVSQRVQPPPTEQPSAPVARPRYVSTDLSPYVVHVMKEQSTPNENCTMHPVSFGYFLKKHCFRNVINGSLKRVGRNRLSISFSNYEDANSFLNNDILKQYNYKTFIPISNITRMGVIRGVPVSSAVNSIVASI